MKVLIVGGVAGGASAAARLRRLCEDAEIVIFERGEYVSFANCGLPYYIGGVISEESKLLLQTPERFWQRFRVEVRTRCEVRAIDREGRSVTVCDLTTGRQYRETYDRLILAPGAAPVKPPVPGTEEPGVFTLRNIPDANAIRDYIRSHGARRAVVVGAGYIGLEMAENLHRAGLSVTVVERAPHAVASLDADMAADVHRCLREAGVSLLTGEGVQAIERTQDGLSVRTDRQTLPADLVLLSAGVRPESALAREAGLALGVRDTVAVNAHMQTSDPAIYAVGDVVQVTNRVTGGETSIPLAGPANRQGRIAADHIAGRDSRYPGSLGTAVLQVFDMTVAAAGIGEEAARRAGIPYDKTYLYTASHATYYPGAEQMSVKILWHRETYRLLGAQITGGQGVDKRMDVLACAMALGADVRALADLELCYAPPFGSAKDPVNMAGFVAGNVIDGTVKQFFVEDIPGLQERADVTLLDVRTPAEATAGRIPGFLHIPLDSLRERIGELVPGRPVYVHCHSGLRSYIACRILSAHGFECFNLAGGYRLYASVHGDRCPAPCTLGNPSDARPAR